MGKSHQLLDELGDITSLHDVRVLEQSLLQTVYINLPVKSVTLYKVDKGRVWCETNLSEEGYRVDSGDKAVSSRHAPIFAKLLEEGKFSSTHFIEEEHDFFYFHLATISDEEAILEVEAKSTLMDDAIDSLTRCIRVYNNYYQMLIYAQTDELTGLLNRKTFNQEIHRISLYQTEKILHQADEDRSDTGADLWLGIIDVDHFKSVNDRFGHVFGDEVLLLVSQQLKKMTRRYDSVYRFGGEEFVVLLRADTRDNAKKAFERFRVGIETLVFPRIGTVTISLGGIRLAGDLNTTALLDKADQALYYAKENGRNCFYLYEDLIEQGVFEASEIDVGDIELF